MKIIAFIPARLESLRLPKKPLIKIDGMPMVMHVYKRTSLCKLLDDVIVCADDNKIIDVIKKINGKALLTSKKFKNGTERISSVSKKINYDLAIDVQCDEVFVDPDQLKKLINFHKKNLQFDIVVPHSITNSFNNKNIVKLAHNSKKEVLYMSRSDVPFFFRNKIRYLKKHLDFISFKKKALDKFLKLKPGLLEKTEGVELLRAIENDLKVGTFNINSNNFSINTPSDLAKAKKIMKKCLLRKYY